MSTRLRVLLRYPNGQCLRGPFAIAQMCSLIAGSTKLRKHVLPKGDGASKKAKLEEVAKLLPKQYALILVQEPKHTRRNRSHCWTKMAPAGPVDAVARQRLLIDPRVVYHLDPPEVRRRG